MADKLKPCPFCGGKAEQLPQCNGGFFVIRCPLCDIRVYRSSRGEALAAWNNRMPATDQFPDTGKMVQGDKICGVTKLPCAYCQPVCGSRKEVQHE